MPVPPVEFELGPVRLARLPLARGSPAAPVACAWLAAALGCGAAGLATQREPHGRPVLGVAGHDANWSHSGDVLLVALGRGVRVGVDVELPRPRPRALELARRWFHPREAGALAALDGAAREAAFLRLWCAKEAVLKAHGRGLAFGLDRLCFDGIAAAPRLVEADPALGAAADWTLLLPDLGGPVAAVAWTAALPAGDAPR